MGEQNFYYQKKMMQISKETQHFCGIRTYGFDQLGTEGGARTRPAKVGLGAALLSAQKLPGGAAVFATGVFFQLPHRIFF